MKLEVGDYVNSTYNIYGGDKSCIIDRIYKRNSGGTYCRLVFSNKRINVPLHSCKMDKAYLRGIKLDELLKD
jgi:hypothetical protein